jgi:tetratricopeptide (TPR) repeat protein
VPRIAALLVVLLVAPASAFAGKKEEAKAHITKATKAHKDGHFEEARVELEAAYALDPNPDLLYAIGQVYAKLGKCNDATTYFKRFGATQKDPKVAKVIDQAIAACKPASGPVANPPRPADLPAQDSPILPTDQSATADKPSSAGEPPTPAASRSQPFASGATSPMVTGQRSPWYKDKLGDGLVLGGIVATIIGVVEYSGAVSDLDTAEDRASTTTLARYNELVDSAHGKRTASVVLIGAGGALITAGVIHYVLHGRTAESHAIGVAPSHGGGVVSYEGRF